MSKSRQRQLAFYLLGVLLAYVLYASNADAGSALLGGVGKLMSPGSGSGSNPSTPFTITTEAGTALTTQANAPLVTQAAP